MFDFYLKIAISLSYFYKSLTFYKRSISQSYLLTTSSIIYLQVSLSKPLQDRKYVTKVIMTIAEGSNSGRIWDHFYSFYLQREGPSMLWVFFEDLLTQEDRLLAE